MFSFLKKQKPAGAEVTFKIDGMHCTSCSMNIDGELEDTEGVLSADTSYAAATTKIVFDDSKISHKKLQSIIAALGYSAKRVI